jgi:hypothetical protein
MFAGFVAIIAEEKKSPGPAANVTRKDEPLPAPVSPTTLPTVTRTQSLATHGTLTLAPNATWNHTFVVKLNDTQSFAYVNYSASEATGLLLDACIVQKEFLNDWERGMVTAGQYGCHGFTPQPREETGVPDGTYAFALRCHATTPCTITYELQATAA